MKLRKMVMKGKTLKQNVEASGSNGSAPESVPASTHTGQASGADELSRIRDILVGGQLREQENFLRSMEKRIEEQFARLREDFERKLKREEPELKKILDALAQRVNEEEKRREESGEETERRIQEVSAIFDRRFEELAETSTKEQRELRNQLVAQGNLMADALQQSHEEVVRDAMQGIEELRTSKVDRALLAGLLSEVSSRLTNGAR